MGESIEKKCVITTIDLLRHGECEDGHCYRGSSDVALTSDGYQKMQQCLLLQQSSSQNFLPWQRVISSSLKRCSRFSNDFAQENQLPIQIESALQEMHFGDWEGQSVEDVWNTQKAQVENWFKDPVQYPPPNGEAADVFSTRVIQCLLSLVKQYQGEHFLLISHGGVMRVLLAHCLSMSLLNMGRFDIPYACFSRMQVIVEPQVVVEKRAELNTAELNVDAAKTEKPIYYYRLIAHNI